MLYVSKDVAFQMEACFKQTHVEVARQYGQSSILEINGGTACFINFDSFFSQVVGWGFKTRPRQFKMELETIERFYRALNHPRVDIELCPFVGTELAVFLGRRGYRVTEVNNVSVLDLSDFQGINNPGDRFLIREVQENEIEQWSERAAAGFGFFELQEQFSHYAKAKGAVAFAAFSGRQWVAGATVAIHGDVCDLGVTSTIPAYRGRGLQKFLLYARLNYAKRHGLALATVTTEPGTISDLNVQKVGFRCAYTRIKMTLGIEY